MALSFKNIVDVPVWRPNSPMPANTAAGGCFAYDLRNSAERNMPFNYFLANATTLYAYNPYNDDWMQLNSPALAGTFGAGATCILHPTQGPRGTIAAGATTTTLTLTTALPAAVGVNQLANCGDGTGFWIRIIGNNSGGSGKIESRQIVANTAGTTPTITLAEPLSFTPGSGAGYEIRGGRIFMLSAGTNATGVFKYYDLATNAVSGNLAHTNLPATIGGDSSMVALSESHVPHNGEVGKGFLDVITATAATSTTITASALSNSASLATNEYRNFQVRVVEDTTTPTAVGQRRRISSHTSGTTPVFTVASFAVTPSSTAKFVVENDDDKILLFTNQTSVYNYNITANTWDTSTWAAAANAGGTGIFAEQVFGIARDVTGNARHSFIYRIRGGAAATIDVLDIAGAATGAWTADVAYANKFHTFTTGNCCSYDAIGNGGKYVYMQLNGTQRFLRFDMQNRVLEPWSYLRYPQSTATVGQKMSMAYYFDGSSTLPFLYSLTQTGATMFSVACHR